MGQVPELKSYTSLYTLECQNSSGLSVAFSYFVELGYESSSKYYTWQTFIHQKPMIALWRCAKYSINAYFHGRPIWPHISAEVGKTGKARMSGDAGGGVCHRHRPAESSGPVRHTGQLATDGFREGVEVWTMKGRTLVTVNAALTGSGQLSGHGGDIYNIEEVYNLEPYTKRCWAKCWIQQTKLQLPRIVFLQPF
ncbi:hypothetical protein FB451DRAFT_1164956 [Mycena latifolia]|nr:hypothetical protein FB451DRAFT_1164956 [Mycena latifolia]